MKTISYCLLYSMLFFFIAGCVCEEPDFFIDPNEVERVFQVTEAYYENNDGERIIIRFNSDVNVESVRPNKTFFVTGDKLNYDNTDYFLGGNLLLLDNCTLGCEEGECEVRIRLVSDPATGEGILSAQNIFLDGDYDGQPGGDFTVTLKATFCNP